ncbi:hypothetical protein [Legionella brunensis]|uniref:Uncharacterized protein n=1 Tax=Legionella brunensis TaxID=29422 RepID=A0A0W0SLU0_9GAMM|nr:hypothetical protein [Legionella brunensis]KTC84228.1 hypothetical protein Lbru_1589 [Legionella brunensis]
MLTKIRNYLANLGSNVVFFSKAAAESSTSLLHNPTAEKIVKPLIAISIEDFLPAAIAYSLNNGLQSSFSKEQESDEDPTVQMVLVAVANFALTGFMINKLIRGGVRSIALSNAIPLLLNEETQDNIPPPKFYSRDTIVFNAKRIQQAMSVNIIDEGISAILPNHYVIQAIMKLGRGYQIVNGALDEQTLTRLSNLKINSLPLMVGSVYLLGTVLRSSILQGVNNPYLDLLIDNVICMSLFTITANLKLQNIPLQSELYSPNPSSLIEHLPVDKMIHDGYQFIKRMPPEELRAIKTVLTTYFRVHVTLAKKAGVLPEVLQSPEKLFDDKVISSLLTSLPESSKTYVLNKYSKQQIKTFLRHLEIVITQRPASHTDDISRFLELDRWVGALKNTIRSNQYSQSTLLTRGGLFRREEDNDEDLAYIVNPNSSYN